MEEGPASDAAYIYAPANIIMHLAGDCAVGLKDAATRIYL